MSSVAKASPGRLVFVDDGTLIDLCSTDSPDSINKSQSSHQKDKSQSDADHVNDRAIAEQLQFDDDDDDNDDDVQAVGDDDKKPAALDLTFDDEDDTMEKDQALAAEMQQYETEQYQQRKQEEEHEMQSSTTGRAWKFVEQVVAMVDRLQQENSSSVATAPAAVAATAGTAVTSNLTVSSVAVDDMVYTTERLLQAQDEFRAAGKPTVVDLGYHYTRSENLNSIKENGLMSMEERNANNVKAANYNGASYGQGIYNAPSPYTFVGKYGDVGLVIVRLRGVDADYGSATTATTSLAAATAAAAAAAMAAAGAGAAAIAAAASAAAAANSKPDSTTVHRGTPTEFCVLSRSRQCIPVLQFPVALIDLSNVNAPGNVAVNQHHQALQALIDEMFNGTTNSASTSSAAAVETEITNQAVAALTHNPVAGIVQSANLATAPQQPSVTIVRAPGQPPKVVLSVTAKQALAKAIWSGIRSPTGTIDPIALQACVAVGLPVHAVVNATRVAREREAKKRQQHAQQQTAAAIAASAASTRQVSFAPQVAAPTTGATRSAKRRKRSSTRAATRAALAQMSAHLQARMPAGAAAVAATTQPLATAMQSSFATAPHFAVGAAAATIPVLPPVAAAVLPTVPMAAVGGLSVALGPAGTILPAIPAGAATALSTTLPSTTTAASRRRRRTAHQGVATNPLPAAVAAAGPLPAISETLQYVAPASLDSGPNKSCLWYVCQASDEIAKDQCSVCLEDLNLGGSERIVELLLCNHFFHESCIVQALAHSPACPTCRTSLGEPQGYMPSGTMTIRSSTSDVCSGYELAGTIIIDYSIPAAAQFSYHTNPGVCHSGARRTAFVPDTVEGRKLLQRLKFAFAHGLTFTVGVSMTTGQTDCVTWASIHHKTSLAGGSQYHGFPDPKFLDNCNGELDALNVPNADDL